jgi:hypothetical protein
VRLQRVDAFGDVGRGRVPPADAGGNEPCLAPHHGHEPVLGCLRTVGQVDDIVAKLDHCGVPLSPGDVARLGRAP